MHDEQSGLAPAGAPDTAQAVPLRIGLRPHAALPWLLLPDGIPAQILGDASVVKVPNTRDWFRGVVSQRGNLLPVFDLGHWAGLGHTQGTAQATPLVIAVGIGAEAFGLLSQQSPGLVRQAEDAIDGDPVALPERLLGYLPQARMIAETGRDNAAPARACEFDVRRWISDIAHDITGTD